FYIYYYTNHMERYSYKFFEFESDCNSNYRNNSIYKSINNKRIERNYSRNPLIMKELKKIIQKSKIIKKMIKNGQKRMLLNNKNLRLDNEYILFETAKIEFFVNVQEKNDNPKDLHIFYYLI
ncbi:hypothetical protein RhiirB3_334005, partial [Rhizophagus irregularis]